MAEDWSGLEEVKPDEVPGSAPAPEGDWSGLEEILGPSPQEVRAAPEQDRSWRRYPRMIGQQGVTGLGRLAGLPGNLERGIQLFLPFHLPELPTSNEVVEMLGRRGLGTTADVMPEGSWERGLAGAVQGGIAAAPLAFGGPGAFLAGVLSGAAGGAAEGVTGSPAIGAGVGLLAGGAGAARAVRGAGETLASRFGGTGGLGEAGEEIQRRTGQYFTPVEQRAEQIAPASPAELVGQPVPAPAGQAEARRRIEGLSGELEVLRRERPTYVRRWGPAAYEGRVRNLEGEIERLAGRAAGVVGGGVPLQQTIALRTGLKGVGDLLARREAAKAGLSSGREISPTRIVNRLLGSPKELAALRAEEPELADMLAAGLIRGDLGRWRKLGAGVKKELVPGRRERMILNTLTSQHSLAARLGEEVGGGATGAIASHWFPSVDPFTGAAIGTLLGAAAPRVLRTGRLVAQWPGLAAPAGPGALGGGLTLVPEVPPRQE